MPMPPRSTFAAVSKKTTELRDGFLTSSLHTSWAQQAKAWEFARWQGFGGTDKASHVNFVTRDHVDGGASQAPLL